MAAASMAWRKWRHVSGASAYVVKMKAKWRIAGGESVKMAANGGGAEIMKASLQLSQ
jgi:hypothetical protein